MQLKKILDVERVARFMWENFLVFRDDLAEALIQFYRENRLPLLEKQWKKKYEKWEICKLRLIEELEYLEVNEALEEYSPIKIEEKFIDQVKKTVKAIDVWTFQKKSRIVEEWTQYYYVFVVNPNQTIQEHDGMVERLYRKRFIKQFMKIIMKKGAFPYIYILNPNDPDDHSIIGQIRDMIKRKQISVVS
jgi:hypothetical protein